MKKSGLFQKSADTSIVENRLRNTVVGEVVTYDSLTTLLGRDSRTFCRSNINSARRSLELESIFFDAISGEGMRRLTEAEADRRSHSRNASYRCHTGNRELAPRFRGTSRQPCGESLSECGNDLLATTCNGTRPTTEGLPWPLVRTSYSDGLLLFRSRSRTAAGR